MAYIQDSTESFTITLTALLEGMGILTLIEVTNVTSGYYGTWEFGEWIAPIPAVIEGDSIAILVTVENNGVTTDTLFGEFISAQVTPSEASIQEMPNILIGNSDSANWTFTMPPNDVNVTINAGHVEPA